MDFVTLTNAIEQAALRNPKDPEPVKDLLDAVRGWGKEEGYQAAKRMGKQVLNLAAIGIQDCNPKDAARFYETWRYGLRFLAPHDLDSFARYIELDRPADKRFYQPRMGYLRPMIRGYQDLIDGKLKLLTVSMPKRAGKSTIEIIYALMLSGRNPDKSILMEGTGDDLVKSFYSGALEYLDPQSEYLYYDVFPEAKVVQTNADTKIINLVHKSRFPTLMCRSIDARQVGLSEATNALILDDCVEGREEAKNRQRLDDKWEVISGDIMGRAIEGTPMVFTGTRYSLYDPIGRVQEFAKSKGWNWRAIEIPALDPVTDESNYEFEMDGKKIFTTEYFREQRELLSDEQFESEFQQQPFEAKGLLFNKDELNYFYELPTDKDPDAIIAVADTAERGADFTCLIAAAVYGNEVYVLDVVYDDAPPEHTKPECANVLIANKASEATFESNNAGEYYARDVDALLKAQAYRCSIRTKRSISNKQTRIEMSSDNVKKNFFFKHPSLVKRGSQYFNYFHALTTYTRTGKEAHDDAPDATAMLETRLRNLYNTEPVVFKRFF